MKGHTPLPGGKDLQRVLEEIGQVVKKHIAQPATENDSSNDGDIQIVQMIEQC